MRPHDPDASATPLPDATRRALAEWCSDCGVCVRECAFLSSRGTPGEIARTCRDDAPEAVATAYSCSLCGLCAALCPESLDPAAFFLDLRRAAVRRGASPLSSHRRLLAYERWGTSRLFALRALPPGCDTVFFPGCSLPGTRPDATRFAFERLREAHPATGLVLGCCGKPSHDLGMENRFRPLFGDLQRHLLKNGVRRVIVACPSCFAVFSRHAPELETITVYERLAELPIPALAVSGEVTVHDPCVLRDAPRACDAVRRLVSAQGLSVSEMKHSRDKTLCCGEGGATGAAAPELAETWGKRRVEEAGGRRIVTYCSGCSTLLGRRAAVAHVLDLCADPAAAMEGRAKVSRGLPTYWNRLRLKWSLRRTASSPAGACRSAPEGDIIASTASPLRQARAAEAPENG